MSQTVMLRSLGLFHRSRKQNIAWFDACFKGKNKEDARNKILNKQFNDIYTLEQLTKLIEIADVNNIQDEKNIKIWYNIFHLINKSINVGKLTDNQLDLIFKFFPVSLDSQIFLISHYPLLAVRNEKFTVDHKIAVAGAFKHFFKIDEKQKDKQDLHEADAIGAEQSASMASSKVNDEVDKQQSSVNTNSDKDEFIQNFNFFKIFKHFVNCQEIILNAFTSLLDEVKDIASVSGDVNGKDNIIIDEIENIYEQGKQALREYIYEKHALIKMETRVYATTSALRNSNIWEKLYKERHEDFAQAFGELNKDNQGAIKFLETQRDWLTGKHILYLVPNLLKYFQNSNTNPGKGFNYFLRKTKKVRVHNEQGQVFVKRPLDKLRDEIQYIITHYYDPVHVNDKDKEVFLKVLQNDQVRGMLNLSTESLEELLAITDHDSEICKVIALDRYLLAKVKKENLDKSPYLKIADEVTKEIAKQNNWFEQGRINSYLRNFVKNFDPNNAEHREKCWYLAAQPKIWNALCTLKIPQPSLFFKRITLEATGTAVMEFVSMSPFFKAKLSTKKNLFELVSDDNSLHMHLEDRIFRTEVRKAAKDDKEYMHFQERYSSTSKILLLSPAGKKNIKSESNTNGSPNRKMV